MQHPSRGKGSQRILIIFYEIPPKLRTFWEAKVNKTLGIEKQKQTNKQTHKKPLL